MEHISPSHLDKYKSILDEINAEHAKEESLKTDLADETNKYLAMRIGMEEAFAKQHVFKVLVKVYDSVFDIYFLHESCRSELKTLSRCNTQKYYVVQVFVSKLFEEKIANHNWLLSISVKSQENHVIKNQYLQTTPYIVVVPFKNNKAAPVTVKTILYMRFDQFWNAIDVSTVNVDISYYFTSAPVKQEVDQCISLSGFYNQNVLKKLETVQPVHEYTFKCKCTTEHFFESLVKNCYHRLNPEVFSTLAVDKDVINVNLCVGSSSATITLDKANNLFNITSDAHCLHRLKTYFIEELNCQNVRLEKMWWATLKNLRQYLRCEMNEEPLNKENMKIIYNELHKMMCDLAF